MNANQHIPQLLPPMTKKAKKRLIIKLVIGVIVLAGIIFGVSALIGTIAAPAREYNAQKEAHRANVLANGIEATATSTGNVRKDRVFSGRRSFTNVYHAHYTYLIGDLDYPVFGEKDYKSEEDIKRGMKATIKYLPSDPLNPVFISEE